MTTQRGVCAIDGLFLLFVLVLASAALGTSGVSACEFTFFPKVVESPFGPRQMVSLNYGPPQVQPFANSITGRNSFTYSFIVRLLKPVNPRLCHWLLVKNEREDVHVPANDITRYPLNEQNGLPRTRCMLNPKTPGAPLGQFPMFSRSGAIMPSQNSAQTLSPLCGDLFYLRMATLLQFTGQLDEGMIKILECQSGREADAQDYVMLPLWSANCTLPPPATKKKKIVRPHYLTPDELVMAGPEVKWK